MIYNTTNLLKEEAILNEATIYTAAMDKKGKVVYSIFTDPQSTRPIQFPYIKVYNNKSYSKASECVRVSMVDGKPFDHSDNDGKKRLKFTKEVAQFLTVAMKAAPTNRSSLPQDVKTVYDAIYYHLKIVAIDKSNFIQYPIPDFFKHVEF